MSLIRKLGRVYILLSLLLFSIVLFKMYTSVRSGKTIAEAAPLLNNPAELEKVVRGVPGGFPAAKLGLGVIYQNKGQLAEAERMYREVLSEQPENPDAWLRLGALYLEKKSWPEAAEAYEHSLKIRPDSARAHNDLAIVYDQLGRYDEALKHYEEAARLDPDPILKENLNQARQASSSTGDMLITDEPPIAPAAAPGVAIDVDAPLTETDDYRFIHPQKVFLKNSRSLVGDIVEKDEKGLWLQASPHAKIYLKRDDILKIEDAS